MADNAREYSTKLLDLSIQQHLSHTLEVLYAATTITVGLGNMKTKHSFAPRHF